METEERSSTIISENDEVLTEVSNVKENKREIRAKRLLERLKLSGVEQCPQINNGKTEIDLSQPSDREDCWLQERFPSLAKNRTKQKTESHAGGKLPSKLVKKSLRSSMLAKTRAELERRRLLYKEDNQDIFGSDEEEEEEVIKEKKKKKVLKPITDSDEDADEDWVEGKSEDGEDEGEESNVSNDDEEDEESCSDDENEDGETGKSEVNPVEHKNDEETDVANSQEKSSSAESSTSNEAVFPSTLSQWFNDDNDPVQDSLKDLEKRSRAMAKANSLVDDELLNLCSGRFDSQVDEDSDEADNASVSDEEDEVILKKKSKDTDHISSQKQLVAEIDDSETVNEIDDVFDRNNIKRVILESDDESDNEETPVAGTDNNVDQVKDHEEEEEEVEEEEEMEDEEEVEEADAGNGDEEDDELAEYNRFLKADYKKKLKKTNYFDDEASLSGDDVGSDLDDELDENNEYEMEEGDNDDVPDAGTIQLQNQKHLMKQELQKEHREIIRLQERLLADGDLGGTKTNRSFRIKLREDLETGETIEELSASFVDEDIENDEDIKLGSEALRMKQELEQATTLNTSTEMTAEECALENAGLAALTASKSLGVKKLVPTLLNKAPLASMFKESTGVVVKQLYTSNVTSTTTVVTKRVLAAETESVAKRRKGNLLDILND